MFLFLRSFSKVSDRFNQSVFPTRSNPSCFNGSASIAILDRTIATLDCSIATLDWIIATLDRTIACNIARGFKYLTIYLCVYIYI